MRSGRAVPHVRKALGERLRAIRRERGLSQQSLGNRAGLSGKFIGEVERAEKSISVDSLFHIAQVFKVSLATLADVATRQGQAPPAEAQQLYALLTRRRPKEIRHALNVVRALLSA